MESRLYFVHALSPLHAGTGQGVGAIDLPIARDAATGRPLLPGSSFKGVLREAHSALGNEDLTRKVFGPPTQESSDHAGAAHFGDARLLLLPVRSLAGTFAWVTCPDVLATFAREVRIGGETGTALKQLPQPKAGACLVSTPFQNANGEAVSSALLAGPQENMVYLEDLDLPATPDGKVAPWAKWISERLFTARYWKTQMRARFCVVPSDVFNFLSETATEVRARIVLNDGKTASNLWYEEALPAESVLAGLVHAAPPKKVAQELDAARVLQQVEGAMTKPLQLGGKATVGRGLCRLSLYTPAAGEAETGGDDAR